MKDIVIATDGSLAAEEALEFGLDLAAEEAAHAWLVHVQPYGLAIVSYMAPPVRGPVEHAVQPEQDEALQRAAALAAERGVAATLVERTGAPADEVSKVADVVDADLIVVGSRGLGPLRRAVLGSTSRELLRKASRPVLVVRAAKVPVEA